mmetsp:Transcript_15650/g.46444  ORF Transcript_15650/g.46444 Transcript_15650/m.46444 type:complete len:204 (+) Transcript_15650:53-664(+)
MAGSTRQPHPAGAPCRLGQSGAVHGTGAPCSSARAFAFLVSVRTWLMTQLCFIDSCVSYGQRISGALFSRADFSTPAFLSVFSFWRTSINVGTKPSLKSCVFRRLLADISASPAPCCLLVFGFRSCASLTPTGSLTKAAPLRASRKRSASPAATVANAYGQGLCLQTLLISTSVSSASHFSTSSCGVWAKPFDDKNNLVHPLS